MTPYTSITEVMTTTIQQSAPLVRLDRIVLGCCGWGGGNAIGSNDDNDIGSGKALGGKNNNQQTMGVRSMMVMGRSRGNDNVNTVQPHLPNAQQPAILG